MNTRKRSGSWSKKQLKGKVIQIYELLFRGEDVSKSNPTFWDELFLIKPKLIHLENEILKMTPEQLTTAKDNINTLFVKCIESLGDEKTIRVVIAMQTLCVLVHSIYKKTSNDNGFDVINLLVGIHNAEVEMQKLLVHCQNFLSGEYPDSLKGLCLKLLLVFVTGTENVSQNTLVEYIMMTSLFESLTQLLSETSTRQIHGHDVVLLLTLLVNYRKHESANPYIVKLSILDDELALNGYGQVITASLTEFCKQYVSEQLASQNTSWFSSLTNKVGNLLFISEEDGVRTQKIRANNALLLALYESIHLNRNFITTLAQMQTDTSSPPSPSNTLNAGHPTPDLTTMPIIDITAQPSNLLVIFFQYCSIVMQDTKSDSGMNTVKLCFIILSCIAEDQYANSLMHDVSLTFKVQLHRMPMRHQKPNANRPIEPQPLVCILLDLLIEFIVSHKMKKLPYELYMLCIGILHRLLVYQKRCRVRINYKWRDLWDALTLLLKYLTQNENNLVKKMNIFELCLKIVNILNFFITYGDTFLPTPGSYDELYYELIRTIEVFTELDAMCRQYETLDNEYKEDARKLRNSLINIQGIGKHFEPKISEWLASQHLSTPSDEQILDIVKANYGSLLLKLQDSLEQYERYSEKPNHANFFTQMVRSVVSNIRNNIDSNSIDIEAIWEEYTTAS